MHIRGNPRPETAERAATPEGPPSHGHSGSAAADTGVQGTEPCCRFQELNLSKQGWQRTISAFEAPYPISD